MNVTVLRSTEKPERLVCQAARGDYFDGYVGDTEYAELMKNVDYDIEYARELLDEADHYAPYEAEKGDLSDTNSSVLEARTRSFIEKQLARGHYGPWEHPQITFAVEDVSRVTMAQITRHRHMTFDVQSQRYVDFSDTEAIVPKSLIDPGHFSRETGEVEYSDEAERERILRQYEDTVAEAMEMYETMVESGIPKEDARFVLPLGTPVNMTFSGNARTFMHVFNLRQKASAQWEIRQLCNRMAEELVEWMPYSFEWYDQNKPHKIGP